jgi:hypothetical protein
MREVGDLLLPHDDFKIHVNGLELAFLAARNLGVEDTEIYACLGDEALRPQELRTDTYEATLVGLRRLVDRIQGRSRPEDALLFVALNHGDMPKGGSADDAYLVAATRVDAMEDDEELPPPLTPRVLDETLRPISGAQVLVVATCFAGAFLPLVQDRRAVVTACAAMEKHRVTRDDGACSAFLNELFGAWCGVSHGDAMLAQHLPLDEAFAHAKAQLARESELDVPHFAGTNVWPQ